MRFYSDQALSQIPVLEPLDASAQKQALEDAARVYAYVRRNEGITDSDLRAYGERNDLPPDQLNTALAVLDALGRLHRLDADIPEPSA